MFSNCTLLESVNIPSSVTSIGRNAFAYCHYLESVTIPSSVTNIGESAFEDCRSLTTISIPSSVTSIGKRAFMDCYGLTSMYSFNPVPPQAGTYCFGYPDKFIPLYVPEGSAEAYRNAREWRNFKNIYEFDPTGISDVEARESGTSVWYDLSGRRHAAPVKGLNIVGGRKVMK